MTTIDDFLERVHDVITEIERKRKELDEEAHSPDTHSNVALKERLHNVAAGYSEARDLLYQNFPEMLNYEPQKKVE